jgi:hypothetical protein
MSRTRILVVALLALMLITIIHYGLADDGSPVVYHEHIGGYYYHTDPICPIANKWNLPMTAVSRFLLNQEPYEGLRPGIFCAPLESDEYYKQANENLTTEEILNQKWHDEVNIKLLDKDHFTFDDWADLFPETFVVPSESDISAEAALDIARAELISIFGIDEDTVITYNASILCKPTADFIDTNEKVFLIQFGNEQYPLLYDVYVLASSGEVEKIERIVIPSTAE